MNTLTLENIQTGMRLQSIEPIERADGIEYPTGSYFQVVALNPHFINLRCTEPGSHWKSEQVRKPTGESEDWFHRVEVSLETFNQSFEVLDG